MKSAMAGALALASVCAHAQSPDEFAFAVPIEGTGSEAFYRVVIPPAVYEKSAFADLHDLRVFNGSGEPVPYAFRSAELHARKSEPIPLSIFPLLGPRDTRAEDMDLRVDRVGDKVSVRLLSRGGVAGQKALLGYLIDASANKTPLTGLAVSWGKSGADQIASVRVEASDDLRHWSALASDVPLGGLSHAGQRLERDTIEFRSSSQKYLRLSWLDAGKAVELAGIRGIVPDQWEQPERMWKEAVAKADPVNPGDFLLDLDGRIPVDRLELRLPQVNTVVPLQVLARDDPKDKWALAGTTVAYRLREEGREVTGPAMQVGGYPHRYWLLRVDMKGGGIGTGDLLARAGWTPRELVFTARGNGPFRMAYGNARAEASALSIDTLVPGLRSERPPNIVVATTGAQQKLAATASAGMLPAEKKKFVLWAALFAGVALLGWMAWKLSTQMQESGKQ